MPHHASSCSADGRFIAAFGIQKKDERGDPLDRKFSPVQLFSAPTGELLKQFECQDGEPNTVVISPDGETIAAVFNVGGEDKASCPPYYKGPIELRLMSVTTDEEDVILEHHEPVMSAHFSPDGRTLVAATYMGSKTLFIFSINKGKVVETRKRVGVSGATECWGPDSTILIGGSLVSPATGAIVKECRLPKAKHNIISPDGSTFATSHEGDGHKAHFFSTVTGEALGVLAPAGFIDAHIDERRIFYSPDGTLFLAGRELYSTPTPQPSSFQLMATPAILTTRCFIGEYDKFYAPDGFTADSRGVVYSNVSSGNLCVINVSDGEIKWCWHNGCLAKAGPDDRESAAGSGATADTPPAPPAALEKSDSEIAREMQAQFDEDEELADRLAAGLSSAPAPPHQKKKAMKVYNESEAAAARAAGYEPVF